MSGETRYTDMVHYTFAQQLERELAAAKDALLKAHKDYGCELRDPNGTIWEHAAKVQQQSDRLERELADLKESITSLSHPNCRDLLRELAEAREQRDRLETELADKRATIEDVGKLIVIGFEGPRLAAMRVIHERDEAREQRDRLAQALRELWNNHTLHGAAYELIEETLSAVKLQIRNHIEK
jgi:chromosome segregation ATPase